jgi:hypothetical protein|tara:strand:- start:59 stop:235 length:177 start_codon:yes stop_codon:yes gene_type:complete
MYDYYSSTPGYLSAAANISLLAGIVFLFINWVVSPVLFIVAFVLWNLSAKMHKEQMKD